MGAIMGQVKTLIKLNIFGDRFIALVRQNNVKEHFISGMKFGLKCTLR
jgi:hypothetical protein